MLMLKKITRAEPIPEKKKPKYKPERTCVGTPHTEETNPWIKTLKAWATEKGLETQICENGFRVDITSKTEDFRLCVIRTPSARYSIALYFDSDSPDYTKSFESCQIPFANMIRFVEWLFEGREQFKFEE